MRGDRFFLIMSLFGLVFNYTNILLVYQRVHIVHPPLLQICFCFYYKRAFMISVSHENQSNIIEGFNSTFRYLENLLNFINEYFEQMINKIYPNELHKY